MKPKFSNLGICHLVVITFQKIREITFQFVHFYPHSPSLAINYCFQEQSTRKICFNRRTIFFQISNGMFGRVESPPPPPAPPPGGVVE